MTARKGEDTRSLKRKHEIGLCGELALEGAMEMLHDREHVVDIFNKLSVFKNSLII